MSYQVLARKWRPRDFSSLVGQEHVVRALTYALEQKRLHHAWLFTGTRGVGKTTLARILAKSLNCIAVDGHGDITSKPCGRCRPCIEIDAGCFVDYLELDAASNRGVDEIAQLLEQAVYAPSNARFKVYMIDEVHMLTHHAFNAMLKTLEEPPAHVKFILATTDPQKIPVTVLSRCLQFNLKQMPIVQIVPYLEQVLSTEKITFERSALHLIARAAQGSMRDALSLTDQAIAYSAESITETAVQDMLGTLDQRYLIRILDGLAQQKGEELLAIADEILERSLSFATALNDLSSLLHKIALVQSIPQALSDFWPAASEIKRLAQLLDIQEVQMFYQIANHGRQDLVLAPDEYVGFSMTLLRMLAFRPQFLDDVVSASEIDLQLQSEIDDSSFSQKNAIIDAANSLPLDYPVAQSTVQAIIHKEEDKKQESNLNDMRLTLESWPDFAAALPLRGLARQLAHQSELIRIDTEVQGQVILHLRVPVAQMTDDGLVKRLEKILTDHLEKMVKLSLTVGRVSSSAACVDADERMANQQAMEQSVVDDPLVKRLIHEFDMAVVPGSVRSLF